MLLFVRLVHLGDAILEHVFSCVPNLALLKVPFQNLHPFAFQILKSNPDFASLQNLVSRLSIQQF